MWVAMRRLHADMALELGTQVGLGVLAAYGVDAIFQADRCFPLFWRHLLLSFLVERGILNEYKHGEDLDERVFNAAATMPCNLEDVGETMLPQLLAQSPADVLSEAEEHMLARGYNPEKPNLDGKFLDWLQKNC